MHRRSFERLLLAGLLALFLVSGAGAALAYWSTAGSGAGSSAVGPLQPVTAVALAGESPSSLMVPGAPAADLVVKVDNQNPFDVTVVAVALNGAITAGNGCSPTGVTLATPANLPASVPPGTSVVHLAGAAAMDVTSASTCQGATFSFPVTLTVHR